MVFEIVWPRVGLSQLLVLLSPSDILALNSLLFFAVAGSDDCSTDKAGDAANHVHDSSPCEVMEALA